MPSAAAIFIHCDTCRLAGRCQARFELHHKALAAWANDEPSVECDDHLPRLFRGIEGVMVSQRLSRPPRPQRIEEQKRIDHGQR